MRISLLVCLLVGRVSAQPPAAVGQPLPDPSLTTGTVVVRVVTGEITMPAVDVPVTLTVNGNLKVVRTDANGRARFEGIAAKAHVRLSLPSTAPELAVSTFVMAETGGIRLVMSSAKWRSPPLPSARDFSGKPRPDPEIAAGTLEVKLTYDNLGDPKPPAGVVVKLVGYAADGTITVASKQTDAKGVAQFTGLDRTEHVAYYPTALLPRDGKLDRLPFLLAERAR